MAESDYKTIGNEFFQRKFQWILEKDYVNAFEKYNKAHTEDPNDCRICSNLSITLLSMMDYEQAEYWADKAIELDPSFTKGFYRRGMARLHLLKFKEAKSDFTHVLQDSPQDSSAKKQINICNQKIKEAAFLEAIRIEEFELTLENIEKIEI